MITEENFPKIKETLEIITDPSLTNSAYWHMVKDPWYALSGAINTAYIESLPSDQRQPSMSKALLDFRKMKQIVQGEAPPELAQRGYQIDYRNPDAVDAPPVMANQYNPTPTTTQTTETTTPTPTATTTETSTPRALGASARSVSKEEVLKAMEADPTLGRRQSFFYD